jgi:hypothetical protein
MTEAHDEYIKGILNQDTETDKLSIGKRFWKYIKTMKKDAVAISIPSTNALYTRQRKELVYYKRSSISAKLLNQT